MPKDFPHNPRVVNDGDDAHRALADGTAQRVHVPDAQDKLPPALGGELERRGWRNARAAGNELRGQSPLRLALIQPPA